MPIWVADSTTNLEAEVTQPHYRIIGSLAELKEWAVNPDQVAELDDIHREYIDDVEVWVDDDKTIKGKRIPEVFDCWVESGSMPYASKHYPFEQKEQFEATYPAQFVSEYIAQTRAWFYTMHVIGVGIFDQHAVENTLTTGTVLAEDGSKMSKSKNNYPDPMRVIDQYGSDSLRLYLMSSPVMRSENLNFSEKEVSEIRKKVFLIWWNCLSFYKLFAQDSPLDLTKPPKPVTVMDRWILSKLHTLISEMTTSMDNYDVVKASRKAMEFVSDLSTWYLRRSRDQLKEGEGREDSLHLFGTVLYQLAQLFAPFTPFFSETVHHLLVNQQTSIHHTDWPTADTSQIDQTLETEMAEIRKIVERVHAARSEAGVKVRQPLAKVSVITTAPEPSQPVITTLLEEVNVKAVEWQHGTESTIVTLDTTITPELAAEGEARELIRSIQKLRKQAGLSLDATATVTVPSIPEGWQTEIEQKTGSQLSLGDTLQLLS